MRLWFAHPTALATRSIPIILDLQQRERAEHMRRGHRRRRVQALAVEVGELRHAEQAEAALYLVLQQLEQAHDRALAAGGERIALQAAEPDQTGAGRDRLDDVGAARERAVDDHLGATGRGVHDLGQDVHRAAPVVELAAAVVRDVDPVDAVLDREPGVLGGRDALDGERNVELALDAVDGAPVERRLVLPARRLAPPAHDVALGDVALAPAVDRGVDREAERRVTLGDGARDVVVDPGGVAAYIELEEEQRGGRGLGDLLEAGLAHRAQHMADAELEKVAEAATFSRPGSHTELSIWPTPNSPAPRTTSAAASRWKHSSEPTGAKKTGRRILWPSTSTEVSIWLTSRSTRGRKAIESSAWRLRRK